MKYVVDTSVNGTPFPTRAGYATELRVFEDDGTPILSMSLFLRYNTKCSSSVRILRPYDTEFRHYTSAGWTKFVSREDFVKWFIAHARECHVVKEVTP